MNFLYYVFPYLTLFNNTQIMNKTAIAQQLYDYGYLNDMNANETEMKASLEEYQYFANIEPTGEMNSETIAMMEKPRCGRPDRLKDDHRKKRYLFGRNGPLLKSTLTYRTQLYTNKLSRKDIDKIVFQALNLWSQHSNLRFEATNQKSDIEVRFEPIDGEGRVYGEALRPTYSHIVLDKDEPWTKDGSNGINLLQVLTHEFGHVLGLGHTDKSKSVMYPFYMEYKRNLALDIDDINGIKALYKNFAVEKIDAKGDGSIFCNDPKIDAIFTAPDGFVYILKNEYYWKFSRDFLMVDGPNLIQSRWPDLPNKIDAAFTAWNNVTYFFKNSYVWKYILDRKHKKSKLIRTAFEKIPGYLDAAFIWSGDGTLYFFKGTQFWMFDIFKPPRMRVRRFFPLPINRWNGVPNNIDDAVSINGVTYFFKNDFYYKYDDFNGRVQKGYPKSIKSDIFKC